MFEQHVFPISFLAAVFGLYFDFDRPNLTFAAWILACEPQTYFRSSLFRKEATTGNTSAVLRLSTRRLALCTRFALLAKCRVRLSWLIKALKAPVMQAKNTFASLACEQALDRLATKGLFTGYSQLSQREGV